MGISKTRDHIEIKIKMTASSQEHPVSSKAPNEDLNEKGVLCTFKIKIESQNFKGVSKSNEHIQIKIKMPYPSQEPPAYSKPLDKDLKDMDVFTLLK